MGIGEWNKIKKFTGKYGDLPRSLPLSKRKTFLESPFLKKQSAKKKKNHHKELTLKCKSRWQSTLFHQGSKSLKGKNPCLKGLRAIKHLYV